MHLSYITEQNAPIYTICHAISILFITMLFNQKWSTVTILKNVENPKSHKSRKKQFNYYEKTFFNFNCSWIFQLIECSRFQRPMHGVGLGLSVQLEAEMSLEESRLNRRTKH